MKRYLLTVLILGALNWAEPSFAQGHYKSFIVSTYAVQGTVQGLMNGNPDPAQSWAMRTEPITMTDDTPLEVPWHWNSRWVRRPSRPEAGRACPL